MADQYDRISTIRVGDQFIGYTQAPYIASRKVPKMVSLNGKSPRVSGKLRLQANVYDASSETAVFTPHRTFTRLRKVVDNYPHPDTITYYLSESMRQDQPEIRFWWDIRLHEDPSNKALIKLWDNISDVNVNLAQIYAERQSSIDTIAGKATAIFKAYSNVRKGRIRKAMENLGISGSRREPRSKQAAGQWLELQYGWLPLVGDIFNLAALSPFAIGAVKGKAGCTSQWKYPNGVVNVKRHVEYGMYVDIIDPVVSFSSQLGLLNPLTIAWELTPFSFVIDWFLPIGNYIENLTADIGFAFRDAYKSTKYVAVIDRPGIKKLIDEEGNYEITEGCRANVSHFNRILLHDSIPKPNLNFKNPISPMHLANAIALGRSLKK